MRFRRRFRCHNGFFSGNRLFLSLDLNQARYAGDPVAFAQFHDLDTFGGSADDPDFIHGDTDNLSAFRCDDEFVTMLDFDCGDNLFTITPYRGYNPEVSYKSSNMMPGFDWGCYPLSRIYSVGLNLTF